MKLELSISAKRKTGDFFFFLRLVGFTDLQIGVFLVGAFLVANASKCGITKMDTKSQTVQKTKQ